MWCGAMNGIASAGVVTCSAVTGLSGTGGGSVYFTAGFQLRPSNGGAYTNFSSVVFMPACETYGQDYWAPVQAAWVAAAIALVGARIVYRRFFTHESS